MATVNVRSSKRGTTIEDERKYEWGEAMGAAKEAYDAPSYRSAFITGWLARARLDGWRPIDDAPVDETVICYHPMYGRFPGHQRPIMPGCKDTVWVNHYTCAAGIAPPTRWMPLPNPPKEDGE